MTRLGSSLAFGLANMLHPAMLWLMVWPLLLAFGLWLAVAFYLWGRAALWIAGQIEGWLETGLAFLELDWSSAAAFAGHLMVFVFFMSLVYLTAVTILGMFGMPAIVEHVAARRYPQLERRRGGSAAGSAWNGVVALAGLAGLALASLPLWLLPPLWPLIPVAILGWANQRLLRYDALAEHGTAAEMREVFRARRGQLYAMGAILALLAYVPVVNFFAPVLFGLAFAHRLLGELEALRRAPIEGEVLGS